ncbi:unnamed protein product [Schistosoma spindalis]|nr:unnamed protein product [Schistosoma spindale]
MSNFSIDHIHVQSIHAYYDPNSKTDILENNHLFHYKSQHFHCIVQLLLNNDHSIIKHHWTIGLVQACYQYIIENRYDFYGSTLWEFHPIYSKRYIMINDSDGNQYPFYNLYNSQYHIYPNYRINQFIELYYEDYFYPTIAWELPSCYHSNNKSTTHSSSSSSSSHGNHNHHRILLTEIIREQQFWVWLIAIKHNQYNQFNPYNLINIEKDEIYILNTIHWKYQLHIQLDPYQSIGKRVKQIHDKQYEQPMILDTNKKLPLSAIHPPHCNAAQSLIWYPNHSKNQSKLIIPPKQIIVPWKIWLNDMKLSHNNNKDYIKKPKQCQYIGGQLLKDQKIGIKQHQNRSQCSNDRLKRSRG